MFFMQPSEMYRRNPYSYGNNSMSSTKCYVYGSNTKS